MVPAYPASRSGWAEGQPKSRGRPGAPHAALLVLESGLLPGPRPGPPPGPLPGQASVRVRRPGLDGLGVVDGLDSVAIATPSARHLLHRFVEYFHVFEGEFPTH